MSEATPETTPIATSPHSPQTNSAANPATTPKLAVPRDIEQGGDHDVSDTLQSRVSAIRHHYRRRVDYHLSLIHI